MPKPMNIGYDAAAGKISFAFDAVAGADSYTVERAGSRLGTYAQIGQLDAGTSSGSGNEVTFADAAPNADKYENYYRITAKAGATALKTFTMSLEQKLFGDYTLFYDIKYDSVAAINADIERVYRIFTDPAEFGAGEFSSDRYALYFKPGDYSACANVNVGYYTHVTGLGKLPTDVKIRSVKTPPERPSNGSLCNFWRSIENLQAGAAGGSNTFNWAVSQAAPARRIYSPGSAVFDSGGNASGGYVADSYFEAAAGSGPQQQYYTRNCRLDRPINGVNWNNFLQGNTLRTGSQPSNWTATSGKDTNIANTPVIREKPFLILDEGEYKVFVPALRRDAVGPSWTFTDPGAGTAVGIDKFYTAIAGRDSAATINEALRAGKNVFFTPGIYELDAPIQVNRADTVVLGTGMATLVPSDSNRYGALLVDDVPGVTVAALMFDSGKDSVYLARIGDPGANKSHADNPTVLSDLIFRNGGFRVASNVDVALQINSSDVVLDHSWIWRADHGKTELKLGGTSGITSNSPAYVAINNDRQKSVGWTMNTSKYGLLVSGDDVTVYGLFVEHFQEYQTLWLGENGRTYFYQCELPYDPTNQAAYMSHNGTVKGFAAYKVGNGVTTHFAAGLGIYEVFNRTDSERGNSEIVNVQNAIEVPHAPGVRIQHACTMGLGAKRAQSDIKFVINGTGESSNHNNAQGPHRVVEFCNGTVTTNPAFSTAVAPADEVFIIPDGGRPAKIVPA